jgi:protein-disulfide isomerase-like protein with CxxC motif
MERTVTSKDDNRPCVTNYKTEGDFLSGKQFMTFQDFPRVSAAAAFDSVGAAIASSGLQITSTNKDLGIISAVQQVSYSSGGKTVPLNAVVRSNTGGGVRVELRFSMSGGLVTSADAVQEKFCTLLATVFTGMA